MTSRGRNGGTSGGLLLECTECSFRRVIAPGDGENPAEVIVEHGRNTGHVVNVTRLDG